MVLEHIFPEDWLEQKGRYAFLLGAGYSIIALLIAPILFPGDPALVAVALTSMLLLPELYKIFFYRRTSGKSGTESHFQIPLA